MVVRDEAIFDDGLEVAERLLIVLCLMLIDVGQVTYEQSTYLEDFD